MMKLELWFLSMRKRFAKWLEPKRYCVNYDINGNETSCIIVSRFNERGDLKIVREELFMPHQLGKEFQDRIAYYRLKYGVPPVRLSACGSSRVSTGD